MRKVLILAAALALSAGPALAQQQQSIASPEPQVTVVAEKPAAPAAQQAEQPVKPSLFVSNEEVRRQVQAAEAQRTGKEQIGSQSWWYLVAAIAIGVLIAVLIAD